MAFNKKGGRKCKFESLETRRMFAGDVTFEVHGGEAEIEGDNFSNGVIITSGLNPNEVVVTGITVAGNPTRVNGIANGSITLPGVIHGMEVKMGLGDDTVNVTNLNINGKSKIDMGPGVDTLNMNNSLFKSKVKIKTNRAMDFVTLMNSTVRGDLNVKTGTGGDNVTLTNMNAGKLTGGFGQGNDSVVISGTTVTTSTTLNGNSGINPFTNGLNNFYGGVINKKNLNGGWGG